MYCLVQTDSFSDLGITGGPDVPLVDFLDVDRDAMPDMVFFKDSSVYTFYNKHSAVGAQETNLCKHEINPSYFKENPLFTKFLDAPLEGKVRIFSN
jgi:hypothetical protein